jgi:phosphopantothenoylcysteine decarboxylase/phosphopantothenate--cysteine ligase
MGYAVARAAREAGAEVTLVSGPTALPTPHGVTRIDVQSAQQMMDAVNRTIDGQHVFIAVAAVADWRVANPSTQKVKKTADGADGAKGPQLQFEQNPDILATIAARTTLAGHPYCVGFAAESENLLEYGSAKRERKGIPLLVGNIGHHTFGQDDNTIVLFDEHGHTILPQAPKLTLARQLISEISKRTSKHSLFQ